MADSIATIREHDAPQNVSTIHNTHAHTRTRTRTRARAHIHTHSHTRTHTHTHTHTNTHECYIHTQSINDGKGWDRFQASVF